MDEKDRTCCGLFEIPDEVLRLLRRAADHDLELACDFGDRDEDVRARVLIAARMVDTFSLGEPSAPQVAELADNALAWREPRPTGRARSTRRLSSWSRWARSES
jgi:hypothetical protein